MTQAQRARRRANVVVAVAGALAIPLGIIAATGARTWLFAVLAAVALAMATARWFRRDPVMVLAALWAFQIVRTPLAAATQSVPLAGPLVDQLTDICLLVILATLAWDVLRAASPRRDLRWFAPAFGLAACGLAGSLIQYAPLEPTAVGLWLGTKLWLLVGVSVAVAWRADDADRVVRVIVPFGAVAAGLGLLDAASGGAVADTLNSNLRVTPFGSYRSDAAQSLYAHPNEFSLAMSLLVAIWLARIATKAQVRARDLALLVVFVAAAIVSLRLKAALSITAVFAIVAAVRLAGGRRHALTVLASGAVSVMLMLAFMGDIIERQLQTYAAGSTSSARSQLYAAGGQIAGDRFPFGVGFGRFGSAPSREQYSEVYDEYGLSRTLGLSRQFPRFITDTSWPSVMGETGIAGLLVFVAGFVALLATGVATLRRARGPDEFAPLALIGVVVVVVVDSTGNPTLFSWNAITPLALIAGAVLAQRRAYSAADSAGVAPQPWTGASSPRRLRRSLAGVGGA